MSCSFASPPTTAAGLLLCQVRAKFTHSISKVILAQVHPLSRNIILHIERMWLSQIAGVDRIFLVRNAYLTIE